MLKFLASLIMCWIIGNVLPLMYALRGSLSLSTETLLVLLIVIHQLVLPTATVICQRRLWSRVRRFMGAVWVGNPQTVNRGGGMPTEHDSNNDDDDDDDAVGNNVATDVSSAGPSSRNAGDGPLEMETRTTQDGHKRTKTESEAIERLDDVDDGRDASQLLFSMLTQNSTGHCNSGKLFIKLRRHISYLRTFLK